MWAILSGIEGNLQAYEAVLKDISCQNYPVEEIYILGDIIGISQDNEVLVNKIRHPDNDIIPRVCRGWWEEQCLILHSLHYTTDPVELIEEYGVDVTKKLWDCVSPETVEWLRNLDFGFVELDCLLIHGSSVNVSEVLTPDTSPWTILDRLHRVNVNYLFCGRSSQMFDYELQEGSIQSTLITLDNESKSQIKETKKKRLIGVGNVGKKVNQGSYTLYNPDNDQLRFRTVNY